MNSNEKIIGDWINLQRDKGIYIGNHNFESLTVDGEIDLIELCNKIRQDERNRNFIFADVAFSQGVDFYRYLVKFARHAKSLTKNEQKQKVT